MERGSNNGGGRKGRTVEGGPGDGPRNTDGLADSWVGFPRLIDSKSCT